MDEVNSFMPGYYDGIEYKNLKKSELKAISLLQSDPFAKKLYLDNYLRNLRNKNIHKEKSHKSKKRFRNI